MPSSVVAAVGYTTARVAEEYSEYTGE